MLQNSVQVVTVRCSSKYALRLVAHLTIQINRWGGSGLLFGRFGWRVPLFVIVIDYCFEFSPVLSDRVIPACVCYSRLTLKNKQTIFRIFIEHLVQEGS